MISRVLIVVFWLSFLLYGQERAPKTNEISCADTSTIHGKTSLARLKARFGAKNVISQGVVVGEGMEEPGAVIFPNDPERRLEIVWPTKSRGTLFIVRGKSDWRTTAGLGLHDSLKKTEKANGRPFILTGFEWDYGGTVTDWRCGTLQGTPGCRLWLRFEVTQRGDRVQALINQVLGDHDFSSGHPAMQELDPEAYEIVVEWK